MIDLDKECYRLLKNNPFFLSFSKYVNKEQSYEYDYGAITIENNAIILYYNPETISSLDDNNKIGFLMHEFLHIILGHVDKRNPFSKRKYDDKFWNYATDLAINSLIEEKYLLNSWVIPGVGIFKEWPKNKTAEYYYNKILLDSNIQDVIISSNIIFDHIWINLEETEKNVIKKINKKFVLEFPELFNECDQNTQKLIKKINYQYSFNKILKEINFFLQKDKNSHTFSFRKLSKRKPYILPGKKTKKKENFALIAVDQSGSIQEEDLKQIFFILEKIKRNISFDLVYFDSKIMPINKITKNSSLDFKRELNGGTDYYNLLSFFRDKKYKNMIVFTDLEASEPFLSKKNQILWVSIKKNNKKLFANNKVISMLDF